MAEQLSLSHFLSEKELAILSEWLEPFEVEEDTDFSYDEFIDDDEQ